MRVERDEHVSYRSQRHREPYNGNLKLPDGEDMQISVVL